MVTNPHISRYYNGRTVETGPQYGDEWIIYPRRSYIRVYDEWRKAKVGHPCERDGVWGWMSLGGICEIRIVEGKRWGDRLLKKNNTIKPNLRMMSIVRRNRIAIRICWMEMMRWHVITKKNNTNKPNLRMMSIVRMNWIAMDSSQEKVHKDKSIRSTVILQNPTSEREPRYIFTPPQPFFVFRCDLKQLFHHYFCERSTMYTTRETYSAQLEEKNVALWVKSAKCIMDVETTTAPHVGVNERSGPGFCSLTIKIISWMASILSKRWPFSVDLSFGSRKKSAGTRSGKYGGCGRTVVACLTKESRTRNDECEGALSCWSIHRFCCHASGLFFWLPDEDVALLPDNTPYWLSRLVVETHSEQHPQNQKIPSASPWRVNALGVIFFWSRRRFWHPLWLDFRFDIVPYTHVPSPVIMFFKKLSLAWSRSSWLTSTRFCFWSSVRTAVTRLQYGGERSSHPRPRYIHVYVKGRHGNDVDADDRRPSVY